MGGSLLDYNWRNMISMEVLAWLGDHIVDNHVISPAAGYLSMAIEATRQLVQERLVNCVIRKFTTRDVAFSKPLIIPQLLGRIEVQLSLSTHAERINSNFAGWNRFLVSSLTQKCI